MYIEVAHNYCGSSRDETKTQAAIGIRGQSLRAERMDIILHIHLWTI